MDADCDSSSSTRIVGPSGSGIFQGGGPCHYCYAMWQPRFNGMTHCSIKLYEGIPQVDDLKKWFGPSKGGVLDQDNLMDKGGNNKRVLDLFTREFISSQHDFFPLGKYAKTTSQNAHYVILFKTPRDQTEFCASALLAFFWQGTLKLFDKCTQQPYRYVMIDLHPVSEDRFSLLSSRVMQQDGPMEEYHRQ